MNLRERRFFIIGIILTISILIFGWLTFLFSDYLIKYSGIITFYSLLAIFIIFAFTEHFKKKNKDKEDCDSLRDILYISDLIKGDIESYSTTLSSGKIPPTTMGSFEYDVLPPEIKSLSTRQLSKKITFANSKVETINKWREGYLEIVFEPAKKLRDEKINQFNIVWGDTANKAIIDLKKTLDEIKSEVSKWIKVDI